MHYYQFNIGDYRRDTQHLTLLEHGIYRLLLDQYYLTEKPLDANALRLLCIRNASDVEIAMRLLCEFFFEIEQGQYIHTGCDKVITKFKEKSLKASTSAKARWDANAMRTHSDGNANHKPITNNQYIKPSSPAKAVAFDFKTALLEAGAKPELADDWLAVRKTKKASNTKTALKGFLSEVEKSGFTVDQALHVCCSRSWQGFQAEWVKDMKPVDTKPAVPAMSPEEHEAKRKADAAAAKERMRQEHAEFLRAQA